MREWDLSTVLPGLWQVVWMGKLSQEGLARSCCSDFSLVNKHKCLFLKVWCFRLCSQWEMWEKAWDRAFKME